MKQNLKRDASERAKAARRAAQLRREVEERVAAEGAVLTATAEGAVLTATAEDADASAAESAPKRRRSAKGYNFTAEAISALRDAQGLSWRQVATNLDLANPGQARKAYTELTGKDYRGTETTTRTKALGREGTSRKFFAPQWDDDSDQDEIIGKLERAVIIVRRCIKHLEFEEEIHVDRVQRLTWDGPAQELCVHFTEWETGGARSVLVKNIKEVQ